MYFVYFKKGMFNPMNFHKTKFYNPRHFVGNLFQTTQVLLWKPYSHTSVFHKTFFSNRCVFCENHLKT